MHQTLYHYTGMVIKPEVCTKYFMDQSTVHTLQVELLVPEACKASRRENQVSGKGTKISQERNLQIESCKWQH